jgi:hypothetical protein
MQLARGSADRTGVGESNESAHSVEFHIRILTMQSIHWQHINARAKII